MSLDQWIAVFTASIGFAGLLAVALQIRASTIQGRLDTLCKSLDVNRQLLSLGFSHPRLFDILNDTPNVDPEWEKRYLQLWLNHLSLVHAFLKNGGFDPEFQDSLMKDIGYLLANQNMQRHWPRHAQYYPPSFQKLLNGMLSDMKPMETAPEVTKPAPAGQSSQTSPATS